MTAMRQRYLYTSDPGPQYRVLIPTWLGGLSAPAAGFAADDTSKPLKPQNIKMRYVLAKDPVSLRHRKVHCGTLTASLFATLSQNVTLPNSDATSTVFVTEGRVGEKTRST